MSRIAYERCMSSRFTRILISVLLPLAPITLGAHLFGCSSGPIRDNEPELLYKDAQDDVESDRYQSAIEKFRTLRNKFPYSKYAVEAQLRLADVYFMQDNFIEAAAAYELFKDLHPKHEKASYALFRASKSFYLDSPSNEARDLSSLVKAQDSYNEYVRLFPSSPEADEARKDLLAVRNKLADKELYIARFYQKRESAVSARNRLEKLVALYPETDAAKEARERLEKLPPNPPRKTEEQVLEELRGKSGA